MSYGYGQQNPFDQRGNGGNAGGLPSRPNFGGNNSYNRIDDDYGSNVEMSSLPQPANPNSCLNEVSEINEGIKLIHQNLDQLKMLQQRALDDPDSSGSSSTNRQLDSLSAETMAQYRSLTDRVRQLKSNPENQQRFGRQVSTVDKNLKDAIRSYQQVESAFRQRTEEQMARQYRIVRPEADEAEVRAAVSDQSGGQVFQQAMMQSNRRGQAQAVLSAVQDRHEQLQKINQQMMELAQLFQDMDTLVMQQDPLVANIEQKGEEVVENLDKGNTEIGTAVNTARSTRKKKWWCLLIVVIIIVIIAVIVAVVVVMNGGAGGGGNDSGNANAKRNILQPSSRSWFEGEPVPRMITSRINAGARRWTAGARWEPDEVAS